ncbi:Adaptin N terminal region [Musa troglodytarum]|uniref:Adaptin N terminal region n=1 Tax=Musa troglodytarum TaxID=320322 RepID=A0A9E7KH09_9LILI|nr:Adaptin N terminal region [Musa troglodytarum]
MNSFRSLQSAPDPAHVLLCAHGEDLLTFRKILSYIIELSKYDLNYDIVLHAAPGYEPLPQPCSLHAKNINLCTKFGYETKQPDLKMDKSNSFGTDDPDISSGSSFEESGSVYDSHHSVINSDGEGDITASDSNEIEHSSLVSMHDTRDDRENTLINISDASADYDQVNQSANLLPTDIVSCILSIEEIASLDPGQRVKIVIQVRFHHHLLPFKLAVLCNGKKYLTKLWPDIGYFLRLLSMSLNALIEKEQQLPGMFEYSKRCTFTDRMEKIDSEKDESSLHADKITLISQTLASIRFSAILMFALYAWTSQFLSPSMMHQACAYDSVGKY